MRDGDFLCLCLAYVKKTCGIFVPHVLFLCVMSSVVLSEDYLECLVVYSYYVEAVVKVN